MPKFDMDKLFDYLIVLVIVVGPILAAIVKKLITFFSPKPPELLELPARPRVSAPEAQRRTARPAAPAAPPAQARRTEPPAVARPRPVARPLTPDASHATDALRRARLPTEIPMTLEAMVEDHLGHLTSSIEGEAERMARGVKSRLEHVETDLGSLRKKRDRPAERKKVARAPAESTALRRLTRQGLRRAILLREILGPPVALRATEEPW